MELVGVGGRVPVYSVAKLFTAAAVLVGGRLALDDPIGQHAQVPAGWRDLRVGDVLSHRSGLRDYGSWSTYQAAVAAREPAWSVPALLERAVAMPILPPGTFRYSNIGYLLIRLALENSYGQDLFDTLAQLVLDPAGMSTARPFTTTADWAGCAPSTVADVHSYDPAWVYPGTFTATPADVTRGVRAIFTGELAGHALPKQMLTTTPVDAPADALAQPGYGLGAMTSGYPRPHLVGHGGAGPGYTLFTLAHANGSVATTHAEPVEISDTELIQRCLHQLRG